MRPERLGTPRESDADHLQAWSRGPLSRLQAFLPGLGFCSLDSHYVPVPLAWPSLFHAAKFCQGHRDWSVPTPQTNQVHHDPEFNLHLLLVLSWEPSFFKRMGSLLKAEPKLAQHWVEYKVQVE